jgi:hypothetical protein
MAGQKSVKLFQRVVACELSRGKSQLSFDVGNLSGFGGKLLL